MMKKILIVSLFSLISCGHQLIQDPNNSSIDSGVKRVESIICGSHAVGENTCILRRGDLLGDLRIYGVNKGSVDLIGCNIDKNFRYEKSGWLVINLDKFIEFKDDCVIDIYLNAEFPGQADSEIKVHGMYGTVTLGSCPSDVVCSGSGVQIREGHSQSWINIVDDSGAFLVRGCNADLKKGSFTDNLTLETSEIIPPDHQRSKDGCILILSMRGFFKHKNYLSVSYYSDKYVELQYPSVVFGKKIEYSSDNTVSIVTINDKIASPMGSFKASPDGDYLRFYTVKGRSLVMFIKDGEIKWIK